MSAQKKYQVKICKPKSIFIILVLGKNLFNTLSLFIVLVKSLFVHINAKYELRSYIIVDPNGFFFKHHIAE